MLAIEVWAEAFHHERRQRHSGFWGLRLELVARRMLAGALQLVGDPGRCGIEIHVLPRQAENLALAQTDERQGERRFVPIAGDRGQDAAGHVRRQRRTPVARDVAEGNLEGDVAPHVAALLSGPQGVAQHQMRVPDRLRRGGLTGLAASHGHPIEDSFEILGGQITDRDLGDRRQVGEDVFVPAIGVRADRGPGRPAVPLVPARPVVEWFDNLVPVLASVAHVAERL